MRGSWYQVLSAVGAIALCGAAGRDMPPDLVPPAAADPGVVKFTVHVIGRVKNPGSYALGPGARLSDALTAAGAYAIDAVVARVGGTPVVNPDCTPGGADLRYVYLARTALSNPPTYEIDVSRARMQHDLRYDPLLREGDKIYVPECRTPIKMTLPPPPFPRSFPD
jgi:hypothetical protein